MKRMTRRMVDAWFDPIRAAFVQMKTGEVDSIKGYAVIQLRPGDPYSRIDFCIDGWIGCLSRIFPRADLSPMTRIKKKLAAGTPMTVDEIDSALALLRAFEKPLMRLPWQSIKSAVQTEMIQIELDAIKEAA